MYRPSHLASAVRRCRQRPHRMVVLVMNARLTCCIPFCPRTTDRAEFAEWICGDHWKTIPNAERRAYGRHTLRWRRYLGREAGAAASRLWRRLKRIATEVAVGI